MNEREQGGTGGINRDFGARAYGDMPSVTDRQRETGGGRDDSFGPPRFGGHGDRPQQEDARVVEGRALDRSADRALRRGRGPRNAARSDSLVAEELGERFTDDELLDASEILLRVEGGHVLLTGEVPERWMKHRAEDIADGVRGVRDIDNRIRVDDGSGSFGTGGAVRSGHSQQGSGFSSSPPNEHRRAPDDRVG